MHHEDIGTILLPVINGLVALALAFIACELGQRMNDAFDKIDIALERSKWYLFPIEIQRLLPMIHAITQQPVSLECFGSITCSRAVFKNVSIDQFNVNATKFGHDFNPFSDYSSCLFVFYGATPA